MASHLRSRSSISKYVKTIKKESQRLWDYTGLFLNINGLVCLRSVLTFAVGSLILNYLLLPLIDKYYNKKYYKYTYIIISIFIIDIIVSNLYRNPYTF